MNSVNLLLMVSVAQWLECQAHILRGPGLSPGRSTEKVEFRGWLASYIPYYGVDSYDFDS